MIGEIHGCIREIQYMVLVSSTIASWPFFNDISSILMHVLIGSVFFLYFSPNFSTKY